MHNSCLINNNYIMGVGCKFYGNVQIGDKTILGNYVSIGNPKESRISKKQGVEGIFSKIILSVNPTRIGTSCEIDSQVVIHEGTTIGNNVFIDDFCRIGYDCQIGNKSRVNYGAFICDRVKIGQNCILAGFICDGTIIENNSTVMGQLVHEYTQPQKGWSLNQPDEPCPKISHHCVVGYGSIVIGGVTIGDHSYITAGSIVTKSVPPKSIVVGNNKIIPYHEWHGKKLAKEFWDWK